MNHFPVPTWLKVFCVIFVTDYDNHFCLSFYCQQMACLFAAFECPVAARAAPKSAPRTNSRAAAPAVHEKKPSSVYLSIISQQTFIGCWKLTSELSDVLNISLNQLQKSAPLKVSFVHDVDSCHRCQICQ